MKHYLLLLALAGLLFLLVGCAAPTVTVVDRGILTNVDLGHWGSRSLTLGNRIYFLPTVQLPNPLEIERPYVLLKYTSPGYEYYALVAE